MINLSRNKAARAGQDASFQAGSIDAIPFSDGEFDVAVGSFMIFHMSDPVRRKGVQEIRRVLRPNGRLLFLDMAEPTAPLPRKIARALFAGMLEHNLRELEPLLTASGFSNVEFGRPAFRILGMSVLGFIRGRVPGE
jgi:ubiquinone/menaquinone biosynthesis C-methylase UbiE